MPINLRFFGYQLPLSIKRLYELENRYVGQRCFILGNGPSLSRTDLSLLKDEYTFGANRIYLLFDQMGFSTTFYVAIDSRILSQYQDDINQLACQKFLLWRKMRGIRFDENLILFRQQTRVGFLRKPWQTLFLGGTVTYVALQLAYFLGFNPVILVGVDHSYSVTRDTAEDANVIAYNEQAGDHFAPNYYEKGDKWFAPDLEKMELSYRIAKFVYERSERQILDATIGGKLQIYPKVSYHSLF